MEKKIKIKGFVSIIIRIIQILLYKEKAHIIPKSLGNNNLFDN